MTGCPRRRLGRSGQKFVTGSQLLSVSGIAALLAECASCLRLDHGTLVTHSKATDCLLGSSRPRSRRRGSILVCCLPLHASRLTKGVLRQYTIRRACRHDRLYLTMRAAAFNYSGHLIYCDTLADHARTIWPAAACGLMRGRA